MELLTNKTFGELVLDVFSKDNEFYMTRKQINDALSYQDDKSLHKIISRHRDVIGEGILITVDQHEGLRVVSRDVELFSFNQIFQILRFSKSAKANAFMEFTASTMKQLLLNKAELVFHKEEDKQTYLNEIKDTIAKARILGFKKNHASLLVQKAIVEERDVDKVILEELKAKQESEIIKKKGRVKQRVDFIAKEFLKGEYAEAWHMLSDRLKFDAGVNMQEIRSRAKTANAKNPHIKIPPYLDLIEKYDIFEEAEKAANKIVKELNIVLKK